MSAPSPQHRFRALRRRLLAAAGAAMAGMGGRRVQAQGLAQAGRMRQLELRDIVRIDPAGDEGWLARDRHGTLWHLTENSAHRPLGQGLGTEGALAVGHGRIAGRGSDGRLWMGDAGLARDGPARSVEDLVSHGGLSIAPDAVFGLVEDHGRTVVARFEPGRDRRWRITARSGIAVLPDAEPVIVDLDGRGDGGHVAVLAGPDRLRYPHAVLGDDIEATQVAWLDRRTLEPLRTLALDPPYVFEDRHLRPWRWAAGRLGLVTVRSGPQGAQLAIVAASARQADALEIAASGPFIGRRNRWLSPAAVVDDAAEVWAVHTPHIGGVLHRYRPDGEGVVGERSLDGVSNHRLGDRALDVSARTGPWLLLPVMGWQALAVVDLRSGAMAGSIATDTAIVQLAAAPRSAAVAVLTTTRLAIWSPA